MAGLLLHNGRIIDPARRIDSIGELWLDGEMVRRLDSVPRNMANTIAIDCTGLWIVPGLIDPHVHLRDPGFPEKETIASGLRAAAAGGFTTVAAMANTSPVNDHPEITRYMLERARQVHAARLIPVAAVSHKLEGRELTDFAGMAAAGARMFSDDGMPIDDEDLLVRALQTAASLDLSISLHEEDRALSGGGAMNEGCNAKRLGVKAISPAAENLRVQRDLALARRANAPVHIAHVSTAESICLIRAARRDGVRVTCEVTPHHFTLVDGVVLEHGPNARMAPPLRSREDRDALCEAIADGTIDLIASDHAPHDPGSKNMQQLDSFFPRDSRAGTLPPDAAMALANAANGIVGIETALGLALQLVHKRIMSPSRLVEMMSLNPSRLLRLDDAGSLAPGAQADVTVIDPHRNWTVDPGAFRSRSRNTPFGGMELSGAAVLTIVKGEVVYDARDQRAR
jgi:dihydroorotase